MTNCNSCEQPIKTNKDGHPTRGKSIQIWRIEGEHNDPNKVREYLYTECKRCYQINSEIAQTH
jgi:hypothetical protein